MIDDRADDALALAEAALAHALGDGVTEAEALVMADDSALTRFANSEIHQNVAETNVTINLRVVVGKRVGVASTGRTDDEGLRRLAENAAAIARVVEELDDWGGLPGPTEIRDVPAAYSQATAERQPGVPGRGRPAVIAAADDAGVTAYGSFATGTESIAVANSDGARAAGTRTTSQLITVSMGPDGGTGYAEAAAVDATTIDAAALGREAAEQGPRDGERRLGRARRLPGRPRGVRGRRPPRHARLSRVLGARRPGGAQLRRDRQADRQRPRDDRRRRLRPGRAADVVRLRGRRQAAGPAGRGRGLPRPRLRRQTAARAGVASTGHGLPAPNPWGPFPLNMVMEPGTATREELIGGLDRGLLVTRFHYTNPVHPKLAIVTGMTRDGTFLVEGGKVVGPVQNLRYTQSYLDALAGTVAVASERKTLKGFLGGVVVPAVRVDGWTFTGGTEH